MAAECHRIRIAPYFSVIAAIIVIVIGTSCAQRFVPWSRVKVLGFYRGGDGRLIVKPLCINRRAVMTALTSAGFSVPAVDRNLLHTVPTPKRSESAAS